MQKIIGILLILFYSGISHSQEMISSKNDKVNRIVFYNVENFFDPYVDSTRKYNEYTYEGNLHWSYKKYEKKRNDLYKTLAAISGWKPLTLVGLAEIENYLVLYELIEKTPFKFENYQIVHFESEDFRGIETGVIYNADLFLLIHAEKIQISTPLDTAFKTRDIIYLKGLLEKDTIHLFYNHWTSRYRGLLESKDYRLLAAEQLKKSVDSITYIDPEAYILCMGDFNDNPADESIRYLANDASGALKQLPYSNTNKDVKGTLKYQGNWSYFDQVIVSESLTISDSGLYIKDNKATIFDAGFLLEKDEKFLGVKPFRTNIGFKYNGGISDHLPIYVDIIRKD
jgi:predicted extracellular nuclease